MRITSPTGRVYTWDKPEPPTQADIDAIVAFDAQEQRKNVGRAKDKAVGSVKGVAEGIGSMFGGKPTKKTEIHHRLPQRKARPIFDDLEDADPRATLNRQVQQAAGKTARERSKNIKTVISDADAITAQAAQNLAPITDRLGGLIPFSGLLDYAAKKDGKGDNFTGKAVTGMVARTVTTPFHIAADADIAANPRNNASLWDRIGAIANIAVETGLAEAGAVKGFKTARTAIQNQRGRKVAGQVADEAASQVPGVTYRPRTKPEPVVHPHLASKPPTSSVEGVKPPKTGGKQVPKKQEPPPGKIAQPVESALPKKEGVVVYHGSPEDHAELNPKKSFGGLNAVFVTPDEAHAASYAHSYGKSPTVSAWKMKEGRFFDAEDPAHIEKLRKAALKHHPDNRLYDTVRGFETVDDVIARATQNGRDYSSLERPDVFRWAKAAGFDGVLLRGDNVGAQSGKDFYAIFNPKKMLERNEPPASTQPRTSQAETPLVDNKAPSTSSGVRKLARPSEAGGTTSDVKPGQKAGPEYVFHNTSSDAVESIAREGMEGGSFSDKPIAFGRDRWIAVKKSDLPEIQSHQYGKAIAHEPAWEYGLDAEGYPLSHRVPPHLIYEVDKRGKVIRRLADPPDEINPKAAEAPLKTEGLPVSGGLHDSYKTGDARLSRNYRAGMNNGKVEFVSELQRDLYDLGAFPEQMRKYANSKGNMRKPDPEAYQQKLTAFAERLGRSEQDVKFLAQDVYNDARAQLKGIQDGELRKLVDNHIEPGGKKPVSNQPRKADVQAAPVIKDRRTITRTPKPTPAPQQPLVQDRRTITKTPKPTPEVKEPGWKNELANIRAEGKPKSPWLQQRLNELERYEAEEIASKNPGTKQVPTIRERTLPKEGDPPSTLAAKNESQKGARAELGLDDLPQAERKSWQKTLDRAEGKGYSKPQEALRLADSINERPRPLSDEESAGLLLRQMEIKTEHRAKLKEIEDAIASGGDLKELQKNLDSIEDEFDRISRAQKSSGTENARALAARKATINEDYDLVSVIQRAKAKKGKDLDPKVRQQLEDLTKQYEQSQSKLADAEAQIAKLQAENRVKAAASKPKRPYTKQDAQVEVQSILDEYKKGLRETLGKAHSGTSAVVEVTYVHVKAVAKLANVGIKLGISTLEEMVKHVRGHIPDISDEQVTEILAGKHNEKRLGPPTPEQASRQKVKAKAKVEADIADFTQQLETGNLRKRDKRFSQADKDLETRRGERDRLRKEIDRAIAAQEPKGFWETARIAQRNWRLSNPEARLVDIASNLTVQAGRQGGKGFEALFDRLLFPKLRREKGAANVGWSWQRAREVGRNAGTRWKQEAKTQFKVGDPDAQSKYGLGEITTGSKGADAIVNLPSRAAGATDIPFKDVVYRGVLNDLAEAKARATGKPRKFWFDNPTDEMVTIAQDEALKAVFGGQNVATEVLGVIDGFITKRLGDKGHALLLARDVLVPFPRIFTNISGYITDHLAGAVKGAVKIKQARKAGEFTIAQRRTINTLFTRNLQGVGMLTLGMYAYQNGILRPKIHKSGYVDHGDIEQMGGPLSVLNLGVAVAAIQDAYDNGDLTDREYQILMEKVALSPVMDQPLVSGPERAAAATSRGGVVEFVKKTAAGTVVPGLLKGPAKRHDQLTTGVRDRKAEGFIQNVQKGVPVLRQQLDPKDDDDVIDTSLYPRKE